MDVFAAWLSFGKFCGKKKKNGVEDVEEVIKRQQFLDSTKVWITAIRAGKNCFGSQCSVCE